MQNYFEAEACLMCESTSVHYSDKENKFICNTCGHSASSTTVKHISMLNFRVIKALFTLLSLLVVSLIASAQQYKVTVTLDNVLYMQNDSLYIDSSKIHFVKFGTGATAISLASISGNIYKPAIHDTLTITKVVHDTINTTTVVTNTIHDTINTSTAKNATDAYTAFKSNFPLWDAGRVAYRAGKDTFTVNGKDTIAYRPLNNVPLYYTAKGATAVDLRGGDVIQLPDITAYRVFTKPQLYLKLLTDILTK